MKREIKFRGKATKDYETSLDGILKGEWVEGNYYYSMEECSGVIVTELQAECGGVGSGLTQVHVPIDGKTLGQYTGRKDKNGKEIFEGDVLRRFSIKEWHSKIDEIYLIEFKKQDLGHSSYQQTIGWNATELKDGRKSTFDKGILDIFDSHDMILLEIIGSIHANPELEEAK